MPLSLLLITILTFLFFDHAGKNVKNLGYLYAISQNAEVNNSLKEKKSKDQVRTANKKITTLR